MSTTNIIELKPATLRLEVTYRDDTQRYEFEGKEVVIGRPNPYLPPTLDLSEDILVSRTHARIWVNVDGYWIEDLVSKHGTFVNGGRLTLRRQLNPGDFIQIGETTLKVLCPAPTRKAARLCGVVAAARRARLRPKALSATTPTNSRLTTSSSGGIARPVLAAIAVGTWSIP